MQLEQTKILTDKYNEYVADFRDSNGVLGAMQQLKLDHSQRVANESKDSAQKLGWSDSDILTSEICGLYHDIGRYSQFALYNTFDDSKSVNHGLHGFEVLNDTDYLSLVDSNDSNLVKDCVLYHNCYALPQDLSPKSVKFLNLIRDSDKLDILFIMSEALKNGELESSPEIIWELPPYSAPSEKILQALRNGTTASFKDAKSGSDICLLQLCWLYNMNYEITLRKILKMQVVETVETLFTKYEKVLEVLDLLKKYLSKYTKSKTIA
ncbi:MAG: HD domain-containing protein [Candidatus Riflebacteria bacterium]|nr:HD domain-containing protein [Candidatus Riflebacteria bacterium]